MRKALCNINLDMVGLSLSENKSFFVLHRTSYGNAHYIGDVLENYYRYVGETNKMNSVVSGSSFFKRIVSPTGTEDPFYYLIENASGGSDHMVFNDWGVQVPGVLLITWPDPYYHTSQDRPGACDPTQLKRSVFITAAAAYSIASAKDEMTLNIAGEVFSNASRRMANQFNKAIDMVNKSGAGNIDEVLKRSLADLHGTSLGEQLILRSVLELEPENSSLVSLTGDYSKALSQLYDGQRSSLINSAGVICKMNNLKLLPVKPDASEKKASALVPHSTDKPIDQGYSGYSDILRKALSDSRLKDDRGAYSTAIELGKLANGDLSLLDIKDIIDAQQQKETDIDTLMELADILNSIQLIKLGGK
ncbi:MAG: M28 family peptidase [Bacteroidia bacterium]|nr:MAG: M28 family peptidase [Bacteroidia bacterium]